MIWKKKKDAAAQSAEAAGEMTGAKGRTGAGAFAKKNWKWLVPLVVVAAAGAVFLIGGGRDDAHPSGCLQLPERHRHAEPGQYIYRQVSGGRQDPHRRL